MDQEENVSATQQVRNPPESYVEFLKQQNDRKQVKAGKRVKVRRRG